MLGLPTASVRVHARRSQPPLSLVLLATLLLALVVAPRDPASIPAGAARPFLDVLYGNTGRGRAETIPPPVPALVSKRELVDRRTQYARHYDLGDGHYLAVAGVTPLNYRDGAGDWQPIQAAFAPIDGGWQVTHNSLRSVLAARGTTVALESGATPFLWEPLALAARGTAVQPDQLARPLSPGLAAPAVLEARGLTLRYARGWSDRTLVEQFHSGPGALKQELILARPPRAVAGAQWLELEARLTIPLEVHIFANGRAQGGDFVTDGAVELRSPAGDPLLSFARPVAYEQTAGGARVAGRYRVIRKAYGARLLVQTPWAWWTDPTRHYPAILDPTMQVVQDLEGANIDIREVDNGFGQPEANARVFQDTCVGHGVDPSTHQRGYSRGYVKFPLPTLPPGAQPGSARLVAVPDNKSAKDPTFFHYGDKITRQPTYVQKMTADWHYLMNTSSVPFNQYPAMESTQILATIQKADPGLGLTKLPATTWNVTNSVKSWYNGSSPNYGFALRLKYEKFASFDTLLQLAPMPLWPTFNCFPTSAQWSNLDDVVANAANPTADGPGLGLLVTYSAPVLAPNETRINIPVVSANPWGSYRHQYHEYRLPASTTNRWRVVAAQGGLHSLHPNTPLALASGAGDVLIASDAGKAAPDNAYFDWQPNYVVINEANPQVPAGLRLRVEADNKPDQNHNQKLYHLQIRDADPAPALPGSGLATTVPISLFRELVRVRELNLVENTTVEIRVPYASAGVTKSTAGRFHLQVFDAKKLYGSRADEEGAGAELTRGPDAYEIEFPVRPGQGGKWALVLHSNQGRQNALNMVAQVAVCANSAAVVRYPLKGECVELRRPPAQFPAGTYKELVDGPNKLRVYSPAGFAGNTTKQKTFTGVPVMPLLGFGTDNVRWVAIKGGTLTLAPDQKKVTTSADARLVMVDFSSPTQIVSLPVLRGQYQVFAGGGNAGIITAISAAGDTFRLVKSPLHELDDASGWSYVINLKSDRMIGAGKIARKVLPTPAMPPTTFSFNAQWWITAHGGPSLKGQVILASITSATLNVGTLLLAPPNTGYSIEHQPQSAPASNPAALPRFRLVRMVGAILAQPENMGAAQLPVQAVLLPPGKSASDSSEGGLLQQPKVLLQCGESCLDLRGPDDKMTAAGPQVDREYRMPDLIVQDSANTVMFNSANQLDVFSTDHPNAEASGAEAVSFNYEAFGGSVRTYKGTCPQPRDPFNPEKKTGQDLPNTTIIVGSAGMTLPNAGAGGGPEISAQFTLCAGSLREMKFTFNTGDELAIPLGNSGLFLHFIGGTISLTPKQPDQPGFTTVVLDVRFRGMTQQATSSMLFSRGIVTIDSRGLFDVQVQTGIQVFGNTGVGIDGHFWVSWASLDLGFEVKACLPYSGFDAGAFPPTLCDGSELLYGKLYAHMWQGQGFNNKYSHLPPGDALHVVASFEAAIKIPAGTIVEWGPAIVPPDDLELVGIKLAFGEFCINTTCTQFEWGVMAALSILGYDLGAYYGFDSGLSFIVGSADYKLIDGTTSSAATAAMAPAAEAQPQASSFTTVTVKPGVPSALFGLAWTAGSPKIRLHEPSPGNRVITNAAAWPDVTTTNTPTAKGKQNLIVVDHPLPGEWQIEVAGVFPDTQFRAFYFTNRAAPTLKLSALPQQVVNATTVPISWTSNVARGSNARLSLYFEQDGTLAGSQRAGGPIVERIPLTNRGTYNWNVQGLATGTYRVYARIDNNAAVVINEQCKNQPYNPDPMSPETQACSTMFNPGVVLPVERVDAPGAMRLLDTIPPAAPQNVGGSAGDISSFIIDWAPNDEPDLGGYIVTCQQEALQRQVRAVAVQPGDSASKEAARVNGLRASPATCSVQAYDVSLNVGGSSTQVTVTPGAGALVSPAAISPPGP